MLYLIPYNAIGKKFNNQKEQKKKKDNLKNK